MAVSDDIEPTTPDLMLAFYRRLYPFKSLFTWLNHEHAPSKLFTHREFAFTLQGDVYLRYNSFANAEELKKQVCSLNPTRFEIGPVYSARVSASALVPVALRSSQNMCCFSHQGVYLCNQRLHRNHIVTKVRSCFRCPQLVPP